MNSIFKGGFGGNLIYITELAILEPLCIKKDIQKLVTFQGS